VVEERVVVVAVETRSKEAASPVWIFIPLGMVHRAITLEAYRRRPSRSLALISETPGHANTEIDANGATIRT